MNEHDDINFPGVPDPVKQAVKPLQQAIKPLQQALKPFEPPNPLRPEPPPIGIAAVAGPIVGQPEPNPDPEPGPVPDPDDPAHDPEPDPDPDPDPDDPDKAPQPNPDGPILQQQDPNDLNRLKGEPRRKGDPPQDGPDSPFRRGPRSDGGGRRG